MSKLSNQYIAGFVDGEGYIGIMKKITPPNKRHRKTDIGHYYCPVIKLVQRISGESVIKAIQTKYGGNTYYTDRSKLKQNNVITLEFRGLEPSLKFVRGIGKYLILKKIQSDILYKFQKIGKPDNSPSAKSMKRRMDIDRERELLYNEIIVLNRRGLAETKR